MDKEIDRSLVEADSRGEISRREIGALQTMDTMDCLTRPR
jgi:hypothetical protein